MAFQNDFENKVQFHIFDEAWEVSNVFLELDA